MNVRMINLGVLCLAASMNAFSEGQVINVSSEAKYYDEKVIATNIINECDQLGEKFSSFVSTYVEKKGWDVSLVGDDKVLASERGLKLQITNAHSGGNAFIGHRKSVSIVAELYENGELIDSYNATRQSGGGFGGGFKGSCSVLGRCVKTLGKDVAKWLVTTSE